MERRVIVGELDSEIILKELYGKASLRAPRALFDATSGTEPRFQWRFFTICQSILTELRLRSLTFDLIFVICQRRTPRVVSLPKLVDPLSFSCFNGQLDHKDACYYS